MAEITKKKLASIYSLIVGFFLTVFSGHAQSGEFITLPSSRKPIESSKTTTMSTTRTTQPQIITSDQTKTSVPAMVQSGGEAGFYAAPAPEKATDTTATVYSSAYTLTNTDEQTFVIRQAEARGLNPALISKEELTGFRIEFLQNKLNELENTLHQLQEGQGN